MTTSTPKFAAPSSVPCIAYVRVSKEDQARADRMSLVQQRDAVTILAGRLGVALGELFSDPGRSGGTAEGRPQFMALVRYCEQHPQPRAQPGYVLVLNDSRWGRFDDPEEATYWRVHLAKQGWSVRFAEGDDTDEPIARGVMRSIGSGVASQYRDTIKRNAKRGARGTAAKGFWCNEAPLGYRRITVGGSRPGTVLNVGQLKTKDEHVKLTPGPESEQHVVRFMFDRYDSGEASLGTLVRELQLRWPGLRKWSRPVLRQLLRNAAYCGDVRWMIRSNGPRDGDEVLVRDAHSALVTRTQWDRVQVRMVRNLKETRATKGGYPLRGLLTCSACGSPYMGAGGPKGPATDPDRYRFYREKERSGHRCGHRQGTLQKRVVEPLVVAEVAKLVSHPEVQRLIVTEIDRQLSADCETTRHKALEGERDRFITKRKRVVDAVADGTIAAADATTTLAELNAAIGALAVQAEQLRFLGARRKTLTQGRERLLALARDFAEHAKNQSGAVLRELLAPWLVGAAFDKDRRALRLTIRRVPSIGLLSVPGRD